LRSKNSGTSHLSNEFRNSHARYVIEVITKRLPEVALSKEKIKEIERSVQEMKKGSYVTLEELKSA
jgi:hypothetical protein